MIYYIADPHFGHENILKLCNRPFDTVEEMDATIIRNWNERVKGNDTVCILGDLFFKNKRPAEDYLAELKGKKVLILGNHDQKWIKRLDLDNYFLEVAAQLSIIDGNRKATLSHYPMMTWPGANKGGFMIYGHIHENTNMPFWPIIQASPAMLNAGVDVNGFAPVTLTELIQNNIEFKEKNPTGGRLTNVKKELVDLYDVDNFGSVLVCAERYSIGRYSYMPLLIASFIRNHKNLLTNKSVSTLIADIESTRDRYVTDAEREIKYNPLGDECDQRIWLELLDFLKTWRKENGYAQ